MPKKVGTKKIGTVPIHSGVGCSAVESSGVTEGTTTLNVEQVNAFTPAYLKPAMTVRLYHDARVAEVISSQNTGAFAASYDYPNTKMRQRNEKQMVNIFLAEWLQFCLKHHPRVTSEA